MASPCRVFRVMAIDDDEDEHLIIRRWVRRSAIPPHIHHVGGAAAAIEYLSSLAPDSPELPHVIFCDVKMPGIDGFQFLQWLRRSVHKRIPVVMRSSSPVTTDVTKAYALGANSYVVKRIGLQATEQRISDLVHYWRDIAEVPAP